MNISIQGKYESIFSNYQNLRMFKGKEQVTSMPRNVHQLLNIELIIHVQAEDKIIEKIYENIVTGKETFTLGRNEDMVRVDEVKIIQKPELSGGMINKYNAYVPEHLSNEISGIQYRLNTKYQIINNLRKWDKVNVKYIERHTNQGLEQVLRDQDEDFVFFYEKEY